VTFDVFGDFETRGYLRNSEGFKDPDQVQRLEHRNFHRNVGKAIEHLRQIGQITYQDVLDTHKTLFQEVYPWAGQDRQATAPNVAIAKGDRDDFFAHPRSIQGAVHYALKLAQDPKHMAERPGEVMGYLAHAHPFLEGNGRTIMVVHNELAHRAGISIDWARTNKEGYLAALTRELDRPGKGELDNYLRPFIRAAVTHEQSAAILKNVRGLGPAAESDTKNREGVRSRQQEESDKRQAPAVEPAERAERRRTEHLNPATAGARKTSSQRESFTPPGQDRPPDRRGHTQDQGRGGRGGRSR
jgi:cell filamentation protein